MAEATRIELILTESKSVVLPLHYTSLCIKGFGDNHRKIIFEILWLSKYKKNLIKRSRVII